MGTFGQILIDALTVGSLYALIALGYTMVYGILKFINFAHSDVFVLGAWSGAALTSVVAGALALDRGALPAWLGPVVLVAAMVLCGTVGFLIERLAYKPLRKAPRLNVLITAMGISLLLQNVGQLQFDLSGAVPHGAVATKAAPAKVTDDRRGFVSAEGFDVRSDRAYWAVFTMPGGKEESRRLVLDDAITRVEAGRPVALAGGVPEGLPAESTVQVVSGIRLNLPFGARPDTTPELVDRSGLIPGSVVAEGTLSGVGALGRSLKLDKAVDLPEGRAFTLRYRLPNDGAGSWRTVPVGRAEGAEADRLRPAVGLGRVENVPYQLVMQPAVQVTVAQVVVFANAILLTVLLQLLVFRTKIGAAMRAVSFSIENASLMGINVNFVISFTFVLGAALAAAAGVLQTQLYPSIQQPASEVWVLLGLKAFVAAVVGGIGNIRGAVLGGFLIAFIEFFATKYISSNLTNVYVFGVLIVVLLVKPEGLLGKPTREKV